MPVRSRSRLSMPARYSREPVTRLRTSSSSALYPIPDHKTVLQGDGRIIHNGPSDAVGTCR